MTPVTNLHTTIDGEGFVLHRRRRKVLAGVFCTIHVTHEATQKSPHPHLLNDNTNPQGSRQVALMLSTNNGELASP